MFDAWKSAIILSLGLTISIEAAKIRCYGQSLTQFDVFELSEIEKLMDCQYFTKYQPNKVIIHGFKGNPDGRFVTNMTWGYISYRTSSQAETPPSNFNVLVLDWSEEASANPLLGDELSYTTVVFQARTTGEQLADAFARISNLGFLVNLTHVIGHSLGSHNAGYCGKRLINKYNLTLERIYGLDPSGPLFEPSNPVHEALSKICANYVFCLHTDPGGKGINASNCHNDAWANNGLFYSCNKTERVQPGCPKGNFATFSENGTCSHDFSWKMMKASLVSEFSNLFLMSFGINYWKWARSNGTATPVTKLPEKIDTTLRGNFYLSVSGDWPHGLEEAGLKPVYETNQQGKRRSSIFDIFGRLID